MDFADEPEHMLVETITTHPARILRLERHGIGAGNQADLVVWDCERVEDVVAALPPRVLVVKRGRITVVSERRIVHRWRAAEGPDARGIVVRSDVVS